jgi:uncharacterized protein
MIQTYFDKLTIAYLIASLAIQLLLFAAIIFMKFRSRFLYFVIIVIAITQAIIIYGSYFEPYRVEVVSETIVINDDLDSQNLKVVLVSDYHLGPYKQDEFVAQTVEMINTLSPDIILITGDFIYSYEYQVDDFYHFAQAKSKYGTYAVLGNHDYGISRSNRQDKGLGGSINKSEYIVQKLEEFGIEVLRNQKITIPIANKELTIVGLEDLWGGELYQKELFEDIQDDDTVIIMQHNPDIILYDEHKYADLIVSGHTHGGQIRLPLWGAIPTLPTSLGKSYDYGLYDLENNGQLFITKGIGEMGPRARLFCRPEIAEINLQI